MICPSIVSRIKRVVMMGGALSSPRGHPTNTPDANCGNVTACAEANIYKDPHAAHRVFNAGFPAADLIMVPIDLTTQTCYASSNIHDVLTSIWVLGAAVYLFMTPVLSSLRFALLNSPLNLSL